MFDETNNPQPSDPPLPSTRPAVAAIAAGWISPPVVSGPVPAPAKTPSRLLQHATVEVTVTGANSAKLGAWLKDYVARASQPDYADNFMHRINDAILARVPQVRDDPLLVEDLDASTRALHSGLQSS